MESIIKNIRAVIRLTAFLSVTISLYIIWFAGSKIFYDKKKWHRTMFIRWSRTIARIVKMSIQFTGLPPTSNQPFFLVSNHLSYMDIVAYGSILGGIFLAKGEIKNWFLAGKIIGSIGTIFIDRKNRRDIARAGEKVTKKLEKGYGIIVFPEGISTKGETVLPFYSSFLEFAARKDFPVSYASITYETHQKEASAREIVCWWQDDLNLFQHIWRLFQLKEFTAKITFGESKVKNSNRKILANELWAKVSENFIRIK